MWVKKTEQECSALENKQRFSFKRPLYASIGFWTVGILFAIVGHPSQYTGWHSGVPLAELVPWLQAHFAIFFIITFVFLYILQLIIGPIKFERSNTVICNKCFKPYTKKSISDCQCGGQLESIEKWKWVEKSA